MIINTLNPVATSLELDLNNNLIRVEVELKYGGEFLPHFRPKDIHSSSI